MAAPNLQEKVQERMDVLSRTKEADEKRFKQNDVPWNVKMMTEVKHTSLHSMELYMELALQEAGQAMAASKLSLPKRREKALATLTGTRGLFNGALLQSMTSSSCAPGDLFPWTYSQAQSGSHSRSTSLWAASTKPAPQDSNRSAL